ncbi:MAG: mandelate racemase/muconate lactonizing enzyme family protein [Gemmataceae bacterium]|nr:mandelate racemase/muconate lactonizing enzyme family protein [Gemmataceae bacterium]
MKIDHLEVINLRYEYPPAQRFAYAGGTCTGRLSSLILVHTDTGAVGIGSAYSHPGLVALIVKQQLEPLLRGRDPREVEFLWDRMYAVTRWYGRKGAAMSAIGGLDVAFWDLRGKALGKPVWSLLGGTRRNCPAYASALLWKPDVKLLAEEAAGYLAKGFRRMKMRLGRSEEYDTEAVRAVRRAIGNDNDLMADASMKYHVTLARRVGKFLAEQRAFWFEEPFQPEDIDSYAALRGTVGVRLAAGENEFGVQGFRELIRAKAVDIVQPDASRCGGISEVWKTAKLAADAGLSFAPHTWSDAVAVIANAHIVAAMPNGLTVEMDQTGNPMIDDLLVEPLRVKDGMLHLNERPGLGIELNDTVVKRLRTADPLAIPDGFYSDMVFGAEGLGPSAPYKEMP